MFLHISDCYHQRNDHCSYFSSHTSVHHRLHTNTHLHSVRNIRHDKDLLLTVICLNVNSTCSYSQIFIANKMYVMNTLSLFVLLRCVDTKILSTNNLMTQHCTALHNVAQNCTASHNFA